MPMQESAKVKEKATKELEKEGMGSINGFFWFPKGTWQWRRYLVKSRCKYKEREAKNRHGNSLQGKIVLKFSLIDDIGRTNMVSARIACFFTNSWKFQRLEGCGNNTLFHMVNNHRDFGVQNDSIREE